MRPEQFEDEVKQSFDPVTGSLRTWLAGGVRSISADARRQRGLHTGLKQVLTQDQPDITASQPWGDFPRVLERQAVREAINSLKPDYRRIVTLAYFGGFTNRQIARVTGVSQSTVRRRLRIALEQMLRYIDRSRGGWASSMAGWTVKRLIGPRASSGPSLGDMLAAGTAATVLAASAVVVLAGTGAAPGHRTANQARHTSAHVSAPAPQASPHALPVDLSAPALSAGESAAGSAERSAAASKGANPSGQLSLGQLAPALPSIGGINGGGGVPSAPAGSGLAGTVGTVVGTAASALPSPPVPRPPGHRSLLP